MTNNAPPLKETTEVRVHIKNLKLKMKNHSFDGTDQIRIFYFFTRFFNEADMLNMSGAQALQPCRLS